MLVKTPLRIRCQNWLLALRHHLWYDTRMNGYEFSSALRVADLVVSQAQDVRAAHRKRSARENKERQQDIAVALRRLREAMRPIRSELARIPYALPDLEGKLGHADLVAQQSALLDASDRIQRERRKLWKMKSRKKGHK